MVDRKWSDVYRASLGVYGQSAAGAEADYAISDQGRYAAIVSSGELTSHDAATRAVYVVDLWQATIQACSIASYGSLAGLASSVSIARNGRHVAFASRAKVYVPGFATGTVEDVYVYDRWDGEMAIATADADGQQADGDSRNPALAASGKWLAFESDADDLAGAGGGPHTQVFARKR